MIAVESLREDIQNGRAVVLLGAGATRASCSRGSLSWTELIAHGANHAQETNRQLPAGWRDSVDTDLSIGASDISFLETAAHKVVAALGGQDSPQMREWLREVFGDLAPDRGDLYGVLDSWGVPIITTNFDTAFEKATGRRDVTWTDHSGMQMSFKGNTRDVAHLHGVWSDATSVILSPTAYGSAMSSASTQLLRGVFTTKTIVLVGCGDGMEDPNFGFLRQWAASTFPGAESAHYRLCTSAELDDFSRTHHGEMIRPLSYGDSFDDLVPWLKELSPRRISVVGSAVANQVEQSRKAIADKVRGSVILDGQWLDSEEAQLDHVVIDPVLLPVSPAQFADARRSANTLTLTRCDPAREALEQSRLVLVADENSGLTTALEWLAITFSEANASVVPVVVDFSDLTSGKNPLTRAVRRQLRLNGVAMGNTDDLPPVALCVDNVSSRPSGIFANLLSELPKMEAVQFLVLGCRTGAELDIGARLDGAGIATTTRYLGHLSRSDVTKLASLVDESRAPLLASRALEIARLEHLPRTPFTMALLISALFHGEALLGSSSGTALLDAYVNLLLGRGDIHEDARFNLDALERSRILASLAQLFVEERAGSLPESQVIARLADYFESLDWTEDPLEVLTNLVRRRILRLSAGQVQFTQSSYLHLFAAKRAQDSPQFRSYLLNDALFFSPVIRHYAALTRNDAEVLESIYGLLPAESSASCPPSLAFATEVADAAPPASIDELLDRLTLPAAPPISSSPVPQIDEDWDDYPLSDRAAFPLRRPELETPIVQIMGVLSLVSNVLRDSEHVEDLDLKRITLHRTLSTWGEFVSLLEEDDGFKDFVSAFGNRLAEELQLPVERREEFLISLSEAAPPLVGLGGMSIQLASRKLIRPLERCFRDDHFASDPATAAMGALLAFSIRERGWASTFVTLNTWHPRLRIIRRILEPMATATYYNEKLFREDDDHLRNFLVDRHLANVEVPTKDSRGRIESRIQQNRLTARMRESMAVEVAGEDLDEID